MYSPVTENAAAISVSVLSVTLLLRHWATSRGSTPSRAIAPAKPITVLESLLSVGVDEELAVTTAIRTESGGDLWSAAPEQATLRPANATAMVLMLVCLTPKFTWKEIKRSRA